MELIKLLLVKLLHLLLPTILSKLQALMIMLVIILLVKRLSPATPAAGLACTIEIETDAYGSETTWELRAKYRNFTSFWRSL